MEHFTNRWHGGRDEAGRPADVVGNPNMFKLLASISNTGPANIWSDSLSAMQMEGGCLVQSITVVGGNLSKTLAYVPGVTIVPDTNGGNKLSTPATVHNPFIGE